jgi:hypothetical protein
VRPLTLAQHITPSEAASIHAAVDFICAAVEFSAAPPSAKLLVEEKPSVYTCCAASGKTSMDDENIALNSVLGLELNRVFFAVHETANKQKIIEFARDILRSERAKPVDSASPDGPAS